ncbi:hypothetical protein [Spirochaeta dissipatitropha]
MLAALITCDREEQFRHSLNGLLHYLPDSCRQVLVCDDSRDPSVVQRKAAVTQQISSVSGRNICFFGREERRAFSAQLTEKTAVPEDLAEFMFFGDEQLGVNSTGASRTALLLKGAGSKLLSFDDDCIFEWRELHQYGSGRLLHGAFAERRAYEQISDVYSGDPLIEMSEMLGYQSRQSRQELQGTARAVMAGLYGGRWFSRPFAHFYIQGPVRDMCYTDKSAYHAAARYPFAFIQAAEPMTSCEPLFVSSAIGLDARIMLPPFVPNIRSEDTIWAMMLRSSSADSRIGHTAFSIGHEFSGRAAFESGDYRSVLPDVGLNVMLITADLLRKQQFDDPAEGLPEIGGKFRAIAALSDTDFSSYMHSLWRKHVEASIFQLERLLQEYDYEPPFWAKDCRVFIRDLQKSLKVHNGHYLEFPYRRLLKHTGDMLIAWPELWNSAIDLNPNYDIMNHGGDL